MQQFVVQYENVIMQDNMWRKKPAEDNWIQQHEDALKKQRMAIVFVKHKQQKRHLHNFLKIQNAEILGQKLTQRNKTNICGINSHFALILQDGINWRVWFRKPCYGWYK